MRVQYPDMPRSTSAQVALLTVALGLAALLAVVFRG
jgi:hypothetical protein